ncbi:helix-turn-helix domain-containing protein [Pontibacter russatus]|uniref:helix-turn-helix domain-containing protein n=1 Tax=Pontibacter russatus TaxID=2694929 RepID=UPI001379700F|nr:helix-turn-helix domain-containing protein [Pontibacter russatus]
MATLLFTRRQNKLANRLLGALVLLLSIQTVLVAYDTRDFFLAFPHLSKVGWLLPSLFGPLIYLFTAKLTSERPVWRKKDFLHLVPFALCLLYLLPYFLQPAAVKTAYLENFDKASEDDFGTLNQLLNFLHLGYTYAALVLIRRHEQNILQRFSELRKVRLRWLKQFVQLIFCIILIGVVVFYARKWNVPWVSEVYHFHYLGVIVCIYWIGYKALSQPAIFNNSLPFPQGRKEAEEAEVPAPDEAVNEMQTGENLAAVKYQKSGLKEDAAEEYLGQLLQFMEERKPYLQNELSIQELAEATGIPRHHLSRVVNERLHKNFYDFVNEYRVAEAKRLLLNPAFSHYTTLAIALEAGFSSKATFNAVFKKQTGLTPTAYVSKSKILV